MTTRTSVIGPVAIPPLTPSLDPMEAAQEGASLRSQTAMLIMACAFQKR